MSDLEALYIFLNKPVDSEMIHYLVATTASIIYVPDSHNLNNNNNNSKDDDDYPTPPNSPSNDNSKNNNIPSLYSFINKLINYSHIQCTTLMTCLIYLNRLKQVIPSNSVGMCTTHHRIFLGSILLAAKYTNDSSPMNKHWTTYTDGLLTLREVNALEIEMIQYIGWDYLRFDNKDLIYSLSYFLEPIKRKLRIKNEKSYSYILQQEEEELQQQQNCISHSSTTSSLPSLVSSTSTSTVSSYMSLPRKDSIQSISSTNTSLASPIIYSNNISKDHKTTSLNNISNKIHSEINSLPLRPLRLKPKSYNNNNSNNNNNNNNNLVNPNNKKNIQLNIPISSSSASLSLKNSKKSTSLINLNSTLNKNISNLNNKENLSSNSNNPIDNLITLIN